MNRTLRAEDGALGGNLVAGQRCDMDDTEDLRHLLREWEIHFLLKSSDNRCQSKERRLHLVHPITLAVNVWCGRHKWLWKLKA